MVSTERGETASVTVSLRAYSLETIKKAAYRLLDRGVVEVVPVGDEARCTISFRSPRSAGEAKRIADDFVAEVLDQDLRQRVAEETAPVRNAILAHAFSRTGLQGDG